MPAVLRFYTATHYSAAAIHWEIRTAYGHNNPHWTESVKVERDWVCSIIILPLTNMHDKKRSLLPSHVNICHALFFEHF